ncbi:MAG TPA: hypothetical protein VMG74_00390 [Gaiellaceae bacterium]|nr:hypothetical protein [Gaiellaceae bacterium]
MAPYELVPDGKGGWKMDLGVDSRLVDQFAMAPDRLEEILQRGSWLVLAFAVWSGPDLEAVTTAVAVARERTNLKVGIRPFDDFAEFDKWCPTEEQTTRSPIWLLLSDGQVVRRLVGSASIDDVVGFVGDVAD